jgi:hypothetical protein
MRTITMRVRAIDFAERIAAMRIWRRGCRNQHGLDRPANRNARR